MDTNAISAVQEYARRPFSMLEISVQKELAIYLNVTSMVGKDWRDIAGECGFSSNEISYLASLPGGQTMNFFHELGAVNPQVTIGDMYSILKHCKRYDALRILDKKFDEVAKRSEAESSQPLDLSTPRRVTYEFEKQPNGLRVREPHLHHAQPAYRSHTEAAQHSIEMSNHRQSVPVKLGIPSHSQPMSTEPRPDVPHKESYPNSQFLGHVHRLGQPQPNFNTPFNGRYEAPRPVVVSELESQRPARPAYISHTAPRPMAGTLSSLETKVLQPPQYVQNQAGHQPLIPATKSRPPYAGMTHLQGDTARVEHLHGDSTRTGHLHGDSTRTGHLHVDSTRTGHLYGDSTRTGHSHGDSTRLEYPHGEPARVGPPYTDGARTIHMHGFRTAAVNGHSDAVVGMEFEGPPPLMPIQHMETCRPNSPPPPYQQTNPKQQTPPYREIPPQNLNAAMTEWRDPRPSLSPSSGSSHSDSIGSTEVHFRSRGSSRIPVENSGPLTMETDEDVTSTKRPLHSIDITGRNEYSSPKVVKKLREDDYKLTKQNTHAFVLNKLRDTLLCSSENRARQKVGDGNMDYSEDGMKERKAAVSQVPTVVEANDDERDEDTGEEENSFLLKTKAKTYPGDGAEKDIDLAALREVISAEAKLESVPFKEPCKHKGKVFLTYDSGVTSQESSMILKDVNHLLKNARHQNFLVSIDTHGPAPREDVKKSIFKKFEEADFVLVCISPTYNHLVKHERLRRERETPIHTNQAPLLYKMMQKEFKKNNYTNNRFIPVLISGARLEDAPEWFKRICPKETFYKYPEQLRNLLYHLSRPDKVMDRFMKKQSLTKPFMSDPPKVVKKVVKEKCSLQSM